ncbi:MAG TPA: 6-phosphogluconolactonase [Polyangiaceae bacterium]|jgi:6-phosphogluconolactonase|nr:6-phosphogluconolactonase [Polyangiaceae bacterium]
MVTEVVDSSQLANVAAERIASALISAIAADGQASLALAGGTTPRAAYEVLARISGIDWGRVNVYFGDERAVPATDPDSNFRMAEGALFSRISLPESNIHRVQTELSDRDAIATSYEALLPERFSLMVLGIGEDGHTASLFPGSPALEERTRRFLPVIGPKPPPERFSVTPPVIEAARQTIVLATGAGKATAVARALKGALDIRSTPSALARGGLWLLDHAAAAELGA